MKISKLENGFTFIEFLIVFAIISILAAIAIPEYQGFQERAYRSEASQNIATLVSYSLAFHVQQDRYGTLEELGFIADATPGGGGAAMSGIVTGASGNTIETIVLGNTRIYHVDWSFGSGYFKEVVTLAHNINGTIDGTLAVTGAYLKTNGNVVKFQVPLGAL